MLNDAVMLLGMIEGIDVLSDAADGGGEDIVSMRARAALPPTIQVAIDRARALANAIERAESAQVRG